MPLRDLPWTRHGQAPTKVATQTVAVIAPELGPPSLERQRLADGGAP